MPSRRKIVSRLRIEPLAREAFLFIQRKPVAITGLVRPLDGAPVAFTNARSRTTTGTAGGRCVYFPGVAGNSFRYSPYPSASSFETGTNLSAALLMQ